MGAVPIVDEATFRAAFPEFADATVYTSVQFALWEAEAERELRLDRWGDSLPLGIMLFVAHNMALSARAAKAAASGGVAGGSISAVASKSVGGVSVSYDTSDASIQGAGEWNSTGYGQRFYRMLRSFGTGPVYVPQIGSPRSFAGPFPFWPR